MFWCQGVPRCAKDGEGRGGEMFVNDVGASGIVWWWIEMMGYTYVVCCVIYWAGLWRFLEKSGERVGVGGGRFFISMSFISEGSWLGR